MKSWLEKSQSPIVFDLAWIMYEVKRARECNGVCGALLFLNFLILALAVWLWLQHSQGNFAFFAVSSFCLFLFSNIQDVSFRKHGSDRLDCFVFDFQTKFTRIICWMVWWLCICPVNIHSYHQCAWICLGTCEPLYEKETKLDRKKKNSDCAWQENGLTLMNCLFWLGEGPQRCGVTDWQCLLSSGPAVFKSVPCNSTQRQWVFVDTFRISWMLKLVAPK